MKTEKLIWVVIFLILCVNLYIVHSFGEMILENQKVAWCGVNIAMKRKSHPRECRILDD